MSKAWCPLPWISVDVRNNGDMRICSHSQQGHDNGLLRKSDGTTFNAAKDSIESSRNSALLKQLRSDMLSGKWNPACKRCQHECESNMLSRNKNETVLWSDKFTIDDARRITDSNGYINIDDSPVMHYGVRFGNKCNLKCRSCGPTESNFWYEDYVDLWNTTEYTESFGKVNLLRTAQGKLIPNIGSYDWYESSPFWEHVERNAHNIRHVHTVGGEPMLIDQQWDFLKKCIDMGISKNIIIEYNSNIVKIPAVAWDLWPHFKEIRIGASVDGIGKVNDYIRYPSRWGMIEENLDRIDANNDINFIVWIASTVMVYNIWHIPDMLEWFVRKRYRKFGYTFDSPLVFFHPLYGPKHLNARILPSDAKNAVSIYFANRLPELEMLVDELYSDNIPRREELKIGIRRHLERWEQFMHHEDKSDMMPKFWRFTDGLDRLRSESMQECMPRFYDILKGNK